MNNSSSAWMLGLTILMLVGCQSAMISMPGVHDRKIKAELDQDQVRQAIKVGAKTAGWQVDEVSNNQMFATYRIREHTVVVSIDYSPDEYSIQYQSSIYMKVKCGVRYDATEPTKVTTGPSPCPGGATPTFIHQNYSDWLTALKTSINSTLKAWST